MSTRKIIVLLVVVLFLVIGLSRLKSSVNLVAKPTASPSPTPTVEPLTGTFVDGLTSRFIYDLSGNLYEVLLPSRIPTQIVSGNLKFLNVRPAWSADGTKLALAVSDQTIAITQYQTGAQVSHIALDPKLDLSKRVEILFSADGNYLSVNQDHDISNIRFYSVATGKAVLELTDCQYLGFWLKTDSFYVSTCQMQGKNQIVIADPSVVGTPVEGIGSADLYTLLNVYDSNSLLVKKQNGFGKLSLTGIFSSLASKALGAIPIDAYANLNEALALKIETQFKTDKIDDLVVSTRNDFAIYHTVKGLWIIALPLKSDPFFLFPGSLPSIQPL